MKIAIGGIKFSDELVHCRYRRVDGAGPAIHELLAGLAQSRINVPFLTITGGVEGESVFCVGAADFGGVEVVLRRMSLFLHEEGRGGNSGRESALLVHREVGTLTIFPHRRSYSVLGRIITALSAAGIGVHSFSTSISALAVNIDYRLLVTAVKALDDLVELPENHAPFHPEFSIRQTAPR